MELLCDAFQIASILGSSSTYHTVNRQRKERHHRKVINCDSIQSKHYRQKSEEVIQKLTLLHGLH